MNNPAIDINNQSILHRSMKLHIGAPGDHLHATVQWWEAAKGHLLVATFAGKTRIERLNRRPTQCAVACIADDVSVQSEPYIEV